MASYWHVIVYSMLGGVVSLVGGILLLRREKSAKALAEYATPFAAGALLAAVFLDLLKEGVNDGEAENVLLAALGGILVFFVAERFLHWFHHHHEHEGKLTDPTTGLIVLGDTLHNALDGVAIAAAFLISVPTGIVTTLAVAAHEIPQEIGDFGLLLHKGMSRNKVLLVNIISALATTFMAVITFALGSTESLPNGILLGVSAGFLLYIAMSDIIPSIHENAPKKKLLDWQPILLIIGVVVVGLMINVTHKYIDVGHGGATSNQLIDVGGGYTCPAETERVLESFPPQCGLRDGTIVPAQKSRIPDLFNICTNGQCNQIEDEKAGICQIGPSSPCNAE
ncbi:MAG: ZIP family metal transporter [Patescibacteria group bacterium]